MQIKTKQIILFYDCGNQAYSQWNVDLDDAMYASSVNLVEYHSIKLYFVTVFAL